MKLRHIAWLGPLTLLTACGGGDSSSPPPSSGPGPTPSPVPPPPPPPPVTYTEFDALQGDQLFDTACSKSGSFLDNGVTPFSQFFTFGFTEATDTWEISGDILDSANASGRSFAATFGNDDIQRQEAGRFVFYSKATTFGGVTEDEVFAIVVPQDEGVSAAYVRTGDVLAFARPSTNRLLYRCVFGVPTTLDDDLPSSTITFGDLLSTSGSAVLSLGNNVSQYRLDTNTTAKITANPSNGEISVTLTIQGPEVAFDPATGETTVSNEITQLGTFTGTVNIIGDMQGFEGSLIDQFGTRAGTFSGWFFGPQGAEIGIAFEGFDDFRNDSSILTFGLTAAGVQDTGS